jgi:hypothetical protein
VKADRVAVHRGIGLTGHWRLWLGDRARKAVIAVLSEHPSQVILEACGLIKSSMRFASVESHPIAGGQQCAAHDDMAKGHLPAGEIFGLLRNRSK